MMGVSWDVKSGFSLYLCVCKSVRGARVDKDTPETKHKGVVLHCEEGKEAYEKYVEVCLQLYCILYLNLLVLADIICCPFFL